MIITISGAPGSGKSTLAKFLALKLKAQHIYIGGIRRELAQKKGMTLEELNQYALTHPETDVNVDKEACQQALSLEKKGNVVVVEGRTSYHFLPKSIKVYMKVDLAEAVKRIWHDFERKDIHRLREGKVKSISELKRQLAQRQKMDVQRYKKYYNLNPYDQKQYDIVIDTTPNTVEQTRAQALKALQRYLGRSL